MTAHHPFLDRESRGGARPTMSPWTAVPAVCIPRPAIGADDYFTVPQRLQDLRSWCLWTTGATRPERRPAKFAGLIYEEMPTRPFSKSCRKPAPCWPSRRFTHQYPHCWRCKNPIIFRATPQWFCSVEAFKDAGGGGLRTRSTGCPNGASDRIIVHGAGARRLVHLPPAPLGPAHSRVLLQGLRQARVHRRDHRSRYPTCSARRAPTPGLRWTQQIFCPKASPARTAAATHFTKEDGHAGRLV